nr:MAG TPA: hypothetical protein [Caudoviricetes sp.]
MVTVAENVPSLFFAALGIVVQEPQEDEELAL